MEILSAEDENGRFLGFAITILHKDIVLLDYLAVSPDRRGNGLGSQILEQLNHRYEGKRILLEIEDPDARCKNKEERLRRRSFYLRNGFAVQDYKVWLFGVKMMILSHAGPVSFDEYHEIFEAVFSPKTGRHVTLA